jgi:hypothetical protein
MFWREALAGRVSKLKGHGGDEIRGRERRIEVGEEERGGWPEDRSVA